MAIVKHCWEANHTINFNSAKIIYRVTAIHGLDF